MKRTRHSGESWWTGNRRALSVVVGVGIMAGLMGFALGHLTTMTPEHAMQRAPEGAITFTPDVPPTRDPADILHPLASTENLPAIAATVVTWMVAHGYHNPRLAFHANTGTYASGDLEELDAFGGEAWFAALRDGRWRIVYVGQGVPRCADLAPYHLPHDFLSCD